MDTNKDHLKGVIILQRSQVITHLKVDTLVKANIIIMAIIITMEAIEPLNRIP
jgi:hypothetical protein